ncbi:MAG: tetratricopeptide repeat protein [Melioribacteraceae bacterium]|nr:tetratricopeptide repeat protein [Melioribacteraceae bacterium]
MSEMLANQYFMARKFSDAESLLENALSTSSSPKIIKRKLIICYVQTNKLDKALNLFFRLIKDDIDFILSADPLLDDCPCAELLGNDYLTIPPDDPYAYNLGQGIMWLYCDIDHSLNYFKNLYNLGYSKGMIPEIITLISEKIKQSAEK